MESDALVRLMQEALPGVHLESAPSRDLQTTVYVPRDDVPAVMRTLRDRPELKFAVLAELTAADFWPREPRFEVIYILVSLEHRIRVRLKVRIPGESPSVATSTDVWPAANWLEREVWDLFGIAFDGHPDPRRLLMPEDWEGFPLRKDYPVQIQMKPHVAEPMQVTAEEFRANLEKDRLARK
jgi:NADH-quinone oxidoreductase subunit C